MFEDSRYKNAGGGGDRGGSVTSAHPPVQHDLVEVDPGISRLIDSIAEYRSEVELRAFEQRFFEAVACGFVID